VEVEDVDVVGLEFLERVSDREMEGLLGVAREVDGLVLSVGIASVARGVLGSDNHAVSILSSFHPFSNPRLRLLAL
jgi:hypothetical protein